MPQPPGPIPGRNIPEVVGGACDWYSRVTVRGLLDPHHGFYGNTPQVLTVADRNHPIARNLPASFNVTDEAYACAWFPDSVRPILTTSFSPPDPLVNLNPERPYTQPGRLVQGFGEQPGLLHPGRSQQLALARGGVSADDPQCDPLGGFAGSPCLGQGQPHHDLQVRRSRTPEIRPEDGMPSPGLFHCRWLRPI